MNTRERHSTMLIEAASRLDPIDLASPAPQLCLKPALELAVQVWKESDHYLHAKPQNPAQALLHSRMRVSILSMRHLLKAAESDVILHMSDMDVVKTVAATLRDVAPRLIIDPQARTEQATQYARIGMGSMQVDSVDRSVRGIRRHDLRETVGGKPYAVLPSNLHALAHEDSVDSLEEFYPLQGRLPKVIDPEAGFALGVGMPIIVYCTGAINDKAVDRTGVEWIRLRDEGANRKDHIVVAMPASRREDAVVLLKQIVVGFRPADLAGKHGPTLMARATALVSRRGPHVNPIGGTDKKGNQNPSTFRSPGNALDWMWLAPQGIVDSHALPFIKAVSFPWKSGEHVTPDKKQMADKELQGAIREREELMKQQEILVREKRGLSPELTKRISILGEQISRHHAKPEPDSNAAKAERVAELRAEYEKRVATELRSETNQLTEMRKMLVEMGKPVKGEDTNVAQRRKALYDKVKILGARIESERARIQAEMRAKLNGGI